MFHDKVDRNKTPYVYQREGKIAGTQIFKQYVKDKWFQLVTGAAFGSANHYTI